ncbi:hypothetical protein QBC46DRAFT_107168 [Diplogelasinospora grovesii]|uniref:Uncharacterized protein n=1 Tax=Diplogelasinospora grovesii TaxID=303347 RepID=A0AAN6MXE6_9PEZI|nr:hypothetical protein QBC46DRAFT_107168 [Diplogelasinospora grovesii]
MLNAESLEFTVAVAALIENMQMVQYLLGRKAPCRDDDVVKYTTPFPASTRHSGYAKGVRFYLLHLITTTPSLYALQRRRRRPAKTKTWSSIPHLSSLQVGIQDTQKVFGFICSTSSRQIHKVAISGSRHSPNNPDQRLHPRLLHNAGGSRLVRDVAKRANFCLPGSENDSGNKPALPEHKGRWYSSRVARTPEDVPSALVRGVTATKAEKQEEETQDGRSTCTTGWCTCKRCQRLVRQQAQPPKQKNKSRRPKMAEARTPEDVPSALVRGVKG